MSTSSRSLQLAILLACSVILITAPSEDAATNRSVETTTPTTTTSTTVLPANTTTAQPAVTSTGHPLPKVYAMSMKCTLLIKHCSNETYSDLLDQFQFCEVVTKIEDCVKRNSKAGNTNMSCTDEEYSRAKLLDCGPQKILNASSKVSQNDVPQKCRARVGTCALLIPASGELTDSIGFKTFFCNSYKSSESCSLTEYLGAVCTKKQYDALVEAADCSYARELVSSCVVICLTLFLHHALSGLY